MWPSELYATSSIRPKDPVLKLEYIEAAWDDKYLKVGMKQLKSQVKY
jgi:hypothetical protein